MLSRIVLEWSIQLFVLFRLLKILIYILYLTHYLYNNTEFFHFTSGNSNTSFNFSATSVQPQIRGIFLYEDVRNPNEIA
jgi:hypothetical protein